MRPAVFALLAVAGGAAACGGPAGTTASDPGRSSASIAMVAPADASTTAPPPPSTAPPSIAPPSTAPPSIAPAPTPAPQSPPPTAPPIPAFAAAVEPLPGDVRTLMTGRSWRPGCPVGLDELLLVTLGHWDFGGLVRTGRLVVHRDHADAIVAAFHALFDARFPIERMQLVDDFAADDTASMAANNTSAFNCREIDGRRGVWSEHSYGWAVDINPVQNPWVRGTDVDPPAGAPYVDRSQQQPGMIDAGGPVVQAFAAVGWTWGGTFTRAQDHQHFSATGG